MIANQETIEKSSNQSLEPQVFQLKTQLLSKGRSDYTIAKTDLMSVRIKCYAQGGENVLHSHPGEDHTFIVLAGKARFFGKDGEVGVFSINQGIMLPRGCFYKFQSCGDEPLVLLRVGAEKDKLPVHRIGVDGNSLPGKSKENKHEDGVPIEGLFYE
ncbi:Cupin 2, conserved barrel [Trichodesmium erythraeum IMS101]|uniref:Cupin 2, conserved barrel n=1 Tax=Trichodesmium erythraeum (strain IMS101) TaxID=203124 RepID=Q113L0_TRIEI|nr:cupin domain-containing protein [Trichodesmium erythraeum GBRTRLIN201]MCL2928271.1 cupin domain-containing protein [Trichodesmium sp. MAG_R01]